jgi:6-methylsalicylate decarboxylase
VLKSIKMINKDLFSSDDDSATAEQGVAASVRRANDAAPFKLDVHQHVWTEPLLTALEGRDELPFVRREAGLTVLFGAGERPYVIERASETAARRAALVREDGLAGALVCLSSPLGIEALPRHEALPLVDAYHEGALALGEPFGVWGALALDGATAQEVERLLGHGCVGLSLPAGALGGCEQIARLSEVLAALEQAGAPLLIHPGPGLGHLGGGPAAATPSLADPLWWSALTRYVSEMQAAWLAFLSTGREQHPRLRVVFSMLAGLAPLQAERLRSRGGLCAAAADPLSFYETSSYGPAAAGQLAEAVGVGQLLYGSDRPVADPEEHGIRGALDWDAVDGAARRMLGSFAPVGTAGPAPARELREGVAVP